MIFRETPLRGAFIIEVEKREDDRGFFSRAWCKEEFEAHGLRLDVVQANINFSKRKGTLRGLHYQTRPHGEIKVVRCTKGAIYDVIIDLRPESSTYKQWIGVELRADTQAMLYVPEGFAHGYQTLEDDTEVFYPVSAYYRPEAERGVRWDDPTFGIKWPEVGERMISGKDRGWPDYAAQDSVFEDLRKGR